MFRFICVYYSLLYLTITTIHGHTLSPHKLSLSPRFHITKRSTMDSNSSTPLPNPNRYITDNDANGESFFFTALPPALPVATDLGGALMRLGYIEAQPPALLTNDTDLKAYENALQNLPPLVPAGGGPAVWYIDTPPNSSSPLHRTVSLDIVIQLEGEIELTLSTGEKRILKPGDLTIQRSTLHQWSNPSKTKWTRMVGVMSECQPVVVGNQTLGAVFPKH